MDKTGKRGLLIAALLLVVSAAAGGCASPTETAQAYSYGYSGPGQQYRYDGADVPSGWEAAEEDSADDRLASSPPPTRAEGGEGEYRETYVYRGGRDPRTDKAPSGNAHPQGS